MAQAETRSVNRCIYTPIENRPEVGNDKPGFVAKQPLLRIAVLQSVLETPELAELVFERLRNDGVTDPPPERLERTFREAWGGNIATAADLINRSETAELSTFIARALSARERMVSEAARDLDHAIATVVARADATPIPAVSDSVSAVRTADSPSVADLVSSIRDAVVRVLRGELPSFLEEAGTRPPAAPGRPPPEGGTGRVRVATLTEEVEEPDLTPTGVDPAIRDDSGPLSAAEFSPISAVRHDEVHALLLDERPGTARFLSLSKYFATPSPLRLDALGETARLIAFTAAQRLAIDRKRDVLQGLDLLGAIEPVGFLHLERLRFTPESYVRGDLVYSLPLVPGEVVRLTHREWTRTEEEYSKLVATSLETATQDALSEKSELTESTSTQQQHTAAFNTAVTASGGFGPMQISSSVGYSASDAASKSATQSLAHSQEITRQASSRSKEEHKITFRVATVHEVEDLSFRELKNDSTEPVRWDFHRLMKKWRIDLYRYDVRMTYDIVVPEPGSYLLLRHIRIARLESLIEKQFELQGAHEAGWNGTPSGITQRNWRAIAHVFGTALDPPPLQVLPTSAQTELTYSSRTIGTGFLEISLPEGYRFTEQPSAWRGVGSRLVRRYIRDDGTLDRSVTLGELGPQRPGNLRRILGGAFRGTSYQWRYDFSWAQREEPEQGSVLTLAVYTHGVPTAATWRAWQMQCYQRVLDAAKTRFEERRQQLIARRDRLRAEIDRDDALALRKLEREEIMKSVLRWVLGRKLEFYPEALPDLTLHPVRDLSYYDAEGLIESSYLSEDGRDGVYAEALARHGELIRFLQHAIEWENVNYVLYPYFWTDRPRWSFKQALFHPDFEHRSFLRAGAARVVLTIRPGFEKAFLSFMETGRLDGLAQDAPYVTVANELRALAQTNYPHTPSANEDNPANHVDTWFEFTPTGSLDVVRGVATDA